MTAIKPEERSKVILLSSGIVAVFSVTGWNLWRNIGPRPSVTAAPPTAANAGASVTNPAAPPSGTGAIITQSDAAPVSERVQQIALPDLEKNPFYPVVSPTAPARQTAQIIPTPAQPAPVQPTPPPNNFIRPDTPPLAVTLPAAPATGVAPVTVAEPTLELMGVVMGQGGLAMFRSGQDQLFVRLGETVIGYRLIRLDTDEVMLRRGNKLRILRVGAGESIVTIPDAQPTKKTPVLMPPAFSDPALNKPMAKAALPALPAPQPQPFTQAKPTGATPVSLSSARRAVSTLAQPQTLSSASPAPVVAAPQIAPAVLRQTTLARPVAVMPTTERTLTVMTAANPTTDSARVFTSEVRPVPVSEAAAANPTTAPGSMTVPVLPGSTTETPPDSEDAPPAS